MEIEEVAEEAQMNDGQVARALKSNEKRMQTKLSDRRTKLVM